MRKWIYRLNESLNCGLKYSESLASKLINRVVHIHRYVKGVGGRKRKHFLSLSWTLETDSCGSVSSVTMVTPTTDVKKLSEQVKSLQNQLQASSRVL